MRSALRILTKSGDSQRRLLLYGAAICLGFQAQAQRAVGVCFGMNFTTQRYFVQGQRANARLVALPHLGLTTAFDIGSSICFQPELLLTVLGMKHKNESGWWGEPSYTDELHYLSLPLAMVGRLPVGKNKQYRLAIGGGPYVGWLMEAIRDDGGKWSPNDLDVGEGRDAIYRSYDYGLTLRALYERQRWFWGATLTYGMVNIQTHGDAQNSRYNRALGLTGGFRLPILRRKADSQ